MWSCLSQRVLSKVARKVIESFKSKLRFYSNTDAKSLFRKNTCPECRSKTTSTNVMRLYVNIVDSAYDENVDGPPDLVGLQNENDNLKFRLIEKDGAIKSKEEAINRLQEENKKFRGGQVKARETILSLEHQIEHSKVIYNQSKDEVKKYNSIEFKTIFFLFSSFIKCLITIFLNHRLKH